MTKFRMSIGPAAANIYDDINNSQLCFDWSYNSIYFKHNNLNWIIISLDSVLNLYEIIPFSLNTQFKSLYIYTYNNLKNYSVIPNNALFKFKKIINLLI